MKILSTIIVALYLIIPAISAAGETTGYRSVTEIFLNVTTVNFYMDQNCSDVKAGGVKYWRLDPGYVDVDKAYAAILSAHASGKSVYVRYHDDPVATDQCMVKRINVR